jgi:hypothetical protein
MRKVIFILTALLICFLKSYSQSDSTFIYDSYSVLSYKDSIRFDSLIGMKIDTTVRKYFVQIASRLTDPELADSVYILVGANKDEDNMGSLSFKIMKDSLNNYFLYIGTTQKNIISNVFNVEILLSRELYGFVRWITIYVKKKTGSYTVRQYLHV